MIDVGIQFIIVNLAITDYSPGIDRQFLGIFCLLYIPTGYILQSILRSFYEKLCGCCCSTSQRNGLQVCC